MGRGPSDAGEPKVKASHEPEGRVVRLEVRLGAGRAWIRLGGDVGNALLHSGTGRAGMSVALMGSRPTGDDAPSTRRAGQARRHSEMRSR